MTWIGNGSHVVVGMYVFGVASLRGLTVEDMVTTQAHGYPQ